jgi:hypothetical protein
LPLLIQSLPSFRRHLRGGKTSCGDILSSFCEVNNLKLSDLTRGFACQVEPTIRRGCKLRQRRCHGRSERSCRGMGIYCYGQTGVNPVARAPG